MSHFKMTCYEAADEMKKRGLFDESVKIVHKGVSNYMELKKEVKYCKMCNEELVKGDNANKETDTICVECHEEVA